MDTKHGKYLGVDYGDKRTGIAECDVAGMLASAIATVSEGGMRHTAERIAKEAKERDCVKIVIGMPRNMDGSYGERAEVVKAFAEILASLSDVPIDFYDERMTTMAAYRFLDASGTFGKKRKDSIDALSAELILQNYIDKERLTKGL